MSSVDEQAIQCKSINVGNNIQVFVENKDSLTEIGNILHAPILKCKKQYAVIGNGVSYQYQD